MSLFHLNSVELALARVVAAIFLVVIVAAGCGGADSGSENASERLRRTRTDIETGIGNTTSDGQRNEYERIRSALQVANLASLKTPTICASTYFPKYDSKHGMLVIDWIALVPQADGVRLEWPSHKTKDMIMSREEIHENEKDVRGAVLYNVGLRYTKGSREEKELLRDPRPMIYLIKNGEKISGAHDLYVTGPVDTSSDSKKGERGEERDKPN